eukprot:GILJ01008105.1.p1 GENE.GILJ01008105.1~~GILJ01008105.1.p1  ORF type:complete len:1289 (-),score=222.87 GILJ01008105.1:110-3976(-)
MGCKSSKNIKKSLPYDDVHVLLDFAQVRDPGRVVSKYITKHNLIDVLRDMCHEILTERPTYPVDYLLKYGRSKTDNVASPTHLNTDASPTAPSPVRNNKHVDDVPVQLEAVTVVAPLSPVICCDASTQSETISQENHTTQTETVERPVDVRMDNLTQALQLTKHMTIVNTNTNNDVRDSLQKQLKNFEISGRFIINEVISCESYGAHLKCLDKFRNTEVRIEVKLKSTDTERIELFIRECTLLSTLQHPNIPRTFYFGDSSPKVLFRVMDLLKGESLESILTKRKRLGVFEAVILICNALETLEYAHCRGVVHRNLSASSLLIQEDFASVMIWDWQQAEWRQEVLFNKYNGVVSVHPSIHPSIQRASNQDKLDSSSFSGNPNQPLSIANTKPLTANEAEEEPTSQDLSDQLRTDSTVNKNMLAAPTTVTVVPAEPNDLKEAERKSTRKSVSRIRGHRRYSSFEEYQQLLDSTVSVDHRCDLYSIATILYRAVTSVIPNDTEDKFLNACLETYLSSPATVTKQSSRKEYATALETVKATKLSMDAVPPCLVGVLHTALNKDPAKRFSSAAEMRASLLEQTGLDQVDPTFMRTAMQIQHNIDSPSMWDVSELPCVTNGHMQLICDAIHESGSVMELVLGPCEKFSDVTVQRLERLLLRKPNLAITNLDQRLFKVELVHVRLNSFIGSTWNLKEWNLSSADIETVLETVLLNQDLTRIEFANSVQRMDHSQKCIRNYLQLISQKPRFEVVNFLPIKLSVHISNGIAEISARSQMPLPDVGMKLLQVSLTNSTVTEQLQRLSITNLRLGLDHLNNLAAILEQNSFLKHLQFKDNGLGDEGSVGIADIIKRSSSIETLEILSQKITDTGCRIIGKSLSKNHSILNFNISDNCFETDGAAVFADVLKRNGTLHSLDLSSNPIGSDGGLCIGAALEHNSTLQSLCLKYCKISDQGAHAIAQSLQRNSTLRFLNLEANSVGNDGVKALGGALAGNSTLNQLIMKGNPIGIEGLRTLAHALTINTGVEILDLSNTKMPKESSRYLADALKRNSCLLQLDLSGNRITAEAAKLLAAALKENRSLIQLDLTDNSMGLEGAKSIAHALYVNTTLRVLKLSTNNMGPEGSRAVAQSLQHNTTLQALYIYSNAMGVDGAKAFGVTLQENKTLLQLHLFYNQIYGDGAAAIAAALQKNRTLQVLDVSSNYIGDDGAKAFGEALLRNQSLETLNMSNNSITEAAIADFVQNLQQNCTLRGLDLQHNRISKDDSQVIEECLKRNQLQVESTENAVSIPQVTIKLA